MRNMIEDEKTIIDFIDDFKSMHKEEIEDLFSNGYCYWFSKILNLRFDNSSIYYMPVYNHFVCKINNNYYDIKGKLEDQEKIDLLILWKDYIYEEPLDSSRVLTYCVYKLRDGDL